MRDVTSKNCRRIPAFCGTAGPACNNQSCTLALKELACGVVCPRVAQFRSVWGAISSGDCLHHGHLTCNKVPQQFLRRDSDFLLVFVQSPNWDAVVPVRGWYLSQVCTRFELCIRIRLCPSEVCISVLPVSIKI